MPPTNREVWKDAVGLEGKYQVSNFGRVRSLPRLMVFRDGTKHIVGGVIRKPSCKRDGRQMLVLEGRGIAVHKLVLEAFVGPRPPGMECCHYPDRNPGNNRLENLRWDTSKANSDDMRVHGTHLIKRPSPGMKNGWAKLTDKQVIGIRNLYATGKHTQVNLAKMFSISQATVSKLVLRQAWKHIT